MLIRPFSFARGLASMVAAGLAGGVSGCVGKIEGAAAPRRDATDGASTMMARGDAGMTEAGSDVPSARGGPRTSHPPDAAASPDVLEPAPMGKEEPRPDARVEAPPPAASMGTIVPLYTTPSHASWNAIIAAKAAHPTVPVIAVFNPASGPGSSASSAYKAGVDRLRAAGIMPMGYVSTAYAQRAESLVQADIDSYRTWYPQTQGIFLDEQSADAAFVDYYRRIDAYAKGAGFTFTVGNPGNDSSAPYVGSVDLILIYESAGLPATSKLEGWHLAHDRMNFGIIPFAVPSLDAAYVGAVRPFVGYIYITNDSLPNPWDTLPPYFNDLLAELAR